MLERWEDINQFRSDIVAEDTMGCTPYIGRFVLYEDIKQLIRELVEIDDINVIKARLKDAVNI